MRFLRDTAQNPLREKQRLEKKNTTHTEGYCQSTQKDWICILWNLETIDGFLTSTVKFLWQLTRASTAKWNRDVERKLLSTNDIFSCGADMVIKAAILELLSKRSCPTGILESVDYIKVRDKLSKAQGKGEILSGCQLEKGYVLELRTGCEGL